MECNSADLLGGRALAQVDPPERGWSAARRHVTPRPARGGADACALRSLRVVGGALGATAAAVAEAAAAAADVAVWARFVGNQARVSP